MDYNDYLESNAQVMLGKPVIEGTRITVELVLKNYQRAFLQRI